MNKLQQRMADNGYVRSNDALIRAQADRACAEWVKYQADKWAGDICEPVILTEQQKQDRDEYISRNKLAF